MTTQGLGSFKDFSDCYDVFDIKVSSFFRTETNLRWTYIKVNEPFLFDSGDYVFSIEIFTSPATGPTNI